ncbi:hypothetical protein D9M70_579620 [compost metagenome]
MHALEDGGEGFATLEVQTTVIDHAGRALTLLALRIPDIDEVGVGRGSGPARTHRKRGIESALDFANIEVDGTGLSTKPQSNGGAQQMRLKRSAHHYSCHAALRLRYQREPHPMQRDDHPRIA